MNFNLQAVFIILLQTTFVSSCGVKSDPRPPKDTLLPSVETRYLEFPKTENKKNKDNKIEEVK